ncbi:helix-turn-helix domain-containing protein [Dysgonomonas sp. Marseille-P4677]|uniref:helix-turn-helix domain-containing protein n=1 Tax=Dysgonomonas sp. Marseille-P4677 TaxID=2364790 RepID=UPI001913481A|nr:helix-turn-helix domain-containing protein [Dysgonomonas sp. Marseille-P4677]MBK5719517.1 helix-turn-helix domain-containing protein [Dysgonomonas sp. Marseille-P4677]
MYLDNNDFTLWMEKLSKKLSDIGKDLKTVITTGEAFVNDDKLLDNQDLAFLLKVSYRTLQRYRNSGKLRYFLVRHKTFYRMADVKDFIQSYASKKEIVMFNKGIEESKILK